LKTLKTQKLKFVAVLLGLIFLTVINIGERSFYKRYMLSKVESWPRLCRLIDCDALPAGYVTVNILGTNYCFKGGKIIKPKYAIT
jgi:hypothetical protein